MRASNKKGVSTLVIIFLLLISALAGGIISYMFTIAPYIKIPETTLVTTTGVFIDAENARSFKIGVLNPSYSPTNATITRIALNLKGESQLYDVAETDPSIENGLIIQRGETLNITCSRILMDDVNVTWGKFASEFAGETIIANVFSSDVPAANMEATLPFVKLDVTDTDFDPKFSFESFNITIMNNANSVINLTISDIVTGITVERISPELPHAITEDPVTFMFNGSWHGVEKSVLTIFTEEGYIFSETIDLPQVGISIQNVILNEDYTDHFNVTMFSFAESANYANVTKISCTLENGTTVERNYPSVSIIPNSTKTLTFDWNWKEYRGKEIKLKAYFLQDFETGTFKKKTPQPIIIKILNEKDVFGLKDKEHLNITLQNHPSSLEAVNITKIVVKETGEVINSTKADPQLPYKLIPDQSRSFKCNITDWSGRAGGNLTLTVYAVTNETAEVYTFPFVIALPVAELNVTSVIHTLIGETQYLNITVENLGYSIWNLTISKVIITPQNQTWQLEQTFPKDQIILKLGDNATLLCVFDWTKHQGESITITVVTDEGVEALQTYEIL